MREEILAHLDNPGQLEKLYRANKTPFKRAFTTLYPELKGNTAAEIWNERLHYENDEISWGTGRELLLVILGAVVAGILAKLPAITGVNEAFYYPRNIGFILFPVLTAYFAWKNKLSTQKVIGSAAVILLSLVFINLLPNKENSDTLVLSCIHLLLVLWSVLGFSYVGDLLSNDERRLGFLKYNGDLVVMTALILIAGGLMTGITIGLFTLIGFRIEEFFFQNIVVFGLPAAPIIGTYLTQTNPQLVGKVSPVIARLFSPVVLVMLVIYLVAMLSAGTDPYNNRDYLLIYNALLIGVMAIIFFSVAETSKSQRTGMAVWVLLLLSAVTVIVNGIALSAILFRISEWGITPNRAAVLGGNVLILVNLLLVTVQLFKVATHRSDISFVERSIARYLPLYCIWVGIVTFIFPFLFGFK